MDQKSGVCGGIPYMRPTQLQTRLPRVHPCEPMACAKPINHHAETPPPSSTVTPYRVGVRSCGLDGEDKQQGVPGLSAQTHADLFATSCLGSRAQYVHRPHVAPRLCSTGAPQARHPPPHTHTHSPPRTLSVGSPLRGPLQMYLAKCRPQHVCASADPTLCPRDRASGMAEWMQLAKNPSWNCADKPQGEGHRSWPRSSRGARAHGTTCRGAGYRRHSMCTLNLDLKANIATPVVTKTDSTRCWSVLYFSFSLCGVSWGVGSTQASWRAMGGHLIKAGFSIFIQMSQIIMTPEIDWDTKLNINIHPTGCCCCHCADVTTVMTTRGWQKPCSPPLPPQAPKFGLKSTLKGLCCSIKTTLSRQHCMDF